MGVRTLLAAGAAAVAMTGVAASAQAGIETFDFTVSSTNWFQTIGSGSPYGLPSEPTLTGQVTIDTSLTDVTAFTALNYKVGTKAYTIGDLDPTSSMPVYAMPGVVEGFLLNFDMHDYVGIGTLSTAQISDGTNAIACNQCVRFTLATDGIPEPATWGLMLLGVMLTGASFRARSATQAATLAAAASSRCP